MCGVELETNTRPDNEFVHAWSRLRLDREDGWFVGGAGHAVGCLISSVPAVLGGEATETFGSTCRGVVGL